MKKSIKPRKFYYSPIGDGVVASDGVEMKRGPVDLSPRITITQTRTVERGAPGKGGVNIIEKNWSTRKYKKLLSVFGFDLKQSLHNP